VGERDVNERGISVVRRRGKLAGGAVVTVIGKGKGKIREN